jgi:SAM-dependent methyltransferase
VKKAVLLGNGRSALVVGCGLGDDAKLLDELGFKVTAFDVSPKAIEWAKEIHKDTKINFYTVDLFNPPRGWKKAFDLVLEVYTVQALPLELREKAIDSISSFVAKDGELVVVTRARENDEEIGDLPWGLSPDDLSRFEQNELEQKDLMEMFDEEEDADEPIKRFVVEYKRN